MQDLLSSHKSHGVNQSEDESSQLPSFYSPQPNLASRADLDVDLEFGEIEGSVSLELSNHADIHTSTEILEDDHSLSLISLDNSGSSCLQASSIVTSENPAPITIPVESKIVNEDCCPKKLKPLPKLPQVKCIVRARIPTTIEGSGTEMYLHLYQNSEDNKEHLAIVFGNKIRSSSLDRVREGETEMDRLIRGAYAGKLYPGRTSSGLPGENPDLNGHIVDMEPPLVRIHSECYTGETVWSARCDCGEQLDEAARLMSIPNPSNPQASGVIIYLRQEGRGIGLGEKLKAYNLQDLGSDTVEANLLLRHPADARSYGLATAMLVDLGVSHVRLLTNNPDKIRAIEGPNREVVVTERVAMIPLAWRKGAKGGIRSKEVGGYLQAKVRLSIRLLF